jgi:hypothetical protein
LETSNPLNPGDVAGTENPQQSVTTPGASDASDFQSTADSEALTQETDSLSVQSTGEPLNSGAQINVASNTAWLWVLGLVAIVLVSALFIRRLSQEEAATIAATTAKKSNTKPAKKSASQRTGSTAKSKTSKKKPARKKSGKRR